MHGLMMDMPLLVSSLIRHADRWHGDTEIVSKTVEGGMHRYTYREAHRRARRLAKALGALGAVIHTINPRLFPDQIAYIANHAEDKVVFFDITFAPLIEKLAPRLKTVQR